MSYFAPLTAIKNRLLACLDTAGLATVQVLVYPFDTHQEDAMPAPCILVRFDGYGIEASASKREAVMTQNWLLEVCVRYGINAPDAQAQLDASGKLVNLCIAAFVGWDAPPLFSVTSPPKPAIDKGYYYVPIALESPRHYTKRSIETI
jgi:hypothetical protein